MNINYLTDPISVIKELNFNKSAQYYLTKEGLVNVTGNVDLSNLNLKELPVKFGIVTGDFDCHYNQLTTLQGCPKEVAGGFSCSSNQLTSLEGGPIKVGCGFDCNNNPLQHIGHLLVCKIKGQIYADQKLLDEYNVLKNTEIIFDNE